jgi:hypothetical protein
VRVSFLHPGILVAGLLAIAIPILIHLLLRRKRQPVKWGAMRFLLEAYRKRRRRLTLEQMLLLATRCLLVALLGAALAKPMWGGSATGEGGRLLVVVIDDSIASGATVGGESDLRASASRAIELLEQADPARGDRVAVIGLGSPARAIVSPPTADLVSVRRTLESLEPTDAGPDWAGSLTLASAIATGLGESNATSVPPMTVILAGGWRAGSIDPEQNLTGLLPETARVVMTSPNPDPAPNVSITALTPDRRVVLGGASGAGGAGGGMGGGAVGGIGRVMVNLSRDGVEPLGEQVSVVRVHDAVREVPLGSVSVRWDEGERERSVPVSLDASQLDSVRGRLLLRASIERDSLDAGNTRLAAIESRRELRVGLLGHRRAAEGGVIAFTPTDWAALALGAADTDFVTRVLDPESATRARLAELDAVLVLEPASLGAAGWDAVGWFVRRGGLAILTPGARDESTPWAVELATWAPFWAWPTEPKASRAGERVGLVSTLSRDPLLAVLSGELEFLLAPVSVSKWVSPRSSIPGEPVGRVLLEAQSGEPWLIARDLDDGTLVWMSSAIDLAWTDLPARPLLLPLLQELLRQGVGPADATTRLVAGAPLPVLGDRLERWDPTTEPASISMRDRADATVRTDPAMRAAGAWLVLDEGDAATGSVIVDADVSAASTTPSDPAAVLAWVGEAGDEIAYLDDTGTGESDTGGLITAATAPASLGWLVLAIALALGVLETWLARRASHVEGAR